MNAARAWQSLVVKGPPGTGKSQTIANLITTLAARGQRGLFVAPWEGADEVQASSVRSAKSPALF